MQIIKQSIHAHENESEVILLSVDRHTLARKRWRGVASDGSEFGFDLENSLKHGAAFLKKEGKLLFCEHGLSPDIKIANWQSRLNFLWGKIAGGCNLDRDIPALIESSGFCT